MKSKDNITKEDIKSVTKVLSKRYILTPIIMVVLMLMEHPNYEISKFIHSFLKSLIYP